MDDTAEAERARENFGMNERRNDCWSSRVMERSEGEIPKTKAKREPYQAITDIICQSRRAKNTTFVIEQSFSIIMRAD